MWAFRSKDTNLGGRNMSKREYDTLVIGHISKDIEIDCDDRFIEVIGGAVVYSSAAAFAGGNRVGVVTKMAPGDRERLIKGFAIPKEDIYLLPSIKTTAMQNKFHTADKERRTSAALSIADPFKIEDIPEVSSTIYHLAGLLYGEFNEEMIRTLSKRGMLAVDVQGFVRHANPAGGKMSFRDWREKMELLPYIHYLKTDAAEAEILTGTSDCAEAAKLLYQWGAREILITCNSGVLVYDGREIHTCPIKARNLSGRPGRGDTTFAAYITERLRAGIPQALLWASAMVSNKMESPGPYKGTRTDVENYINAFYQKGHMYADN